MRLALEQLLIGFLYESTISAEFQVYNRNSNTVYPQAALIVAHSKDSIVLLRAKTLGCTATGSYSWHLPIKLPSYYSIIHMKLSEKGSFTQYPLIHTVCITHNGNSLFLLKVGTFINAVFLPQQRQTDNATWKIMLMKQLP